MAFVGNGQKLIGDDGTIFDAIAGSEAEGDGATPLAEGHYLITAVAGSSGWPGTSGASGAEQVGVGRIIEVRATDTAITPETGDKYIPLTMTELCDISSWNVAFAGDEVEVTTFCNEFKLYRAGKDDANGTLSGIFTIGTTDKVTGLALANNFIDIVKQDGGDTIDVHQKVKGAKLARLVLNKEFDIGDYFEMWAPIDLIGFNLGAEQGANAQAFDSNFRFTQMNLGAADVSVLATLYRRARSEENT